MKALVFDTETTGLIRNRSIKLDLQPEIIEWYSCVADLKTGRMTNKIEWMLKPKKPISDEITRITGITNAMVNHSTVFSVAGKRFIKAVEEADLVIGHNVKFDMDMLEIEAERCGWTVKWPRVLCTIEQTVHLKGYRMNLNALHTFLFDEPFAGAHRAAQDVEALVRCCTELFKRGLIK